MKKLLFIFLLLPIFASGQIMIGHEIKCDTIFNETTLDITPEFYLECDTTYYVIKAIKSEIAGFDSPNLALIERIEDEIVILSGITKNGEFIGGKGRYFWYKGDKKNLPFNDITEDEIKALRE